MATSEAASAAGRIIEFLEEQDIDVPLVERVESLGESEFAAIIEIEGSTDVLAGEVAVVEVDQRQEREFIDETTTADLKQSETNSDAIDQSDDSNVNVDDEPDQDNTGDDESQSGIREEMEGLTDLRRDIVVSLFRRGECRADDIREDVDTKWVNKPLKTLGERGVVEYQDHPDDGRVTLWSLTEEAEGVARDIIGSSNVPDWCDGHPVDLLDEYEHSFGNRSSYEVLEAARTNDDVVGAHQRIAGNNLNTTRELYRRLGLLTIGHGWEDDVTERVEELQEVIS